MYPYCILSTSSYLAFEDEMIKKFKNFLHKIKMFRSVRMSFEDNSSHRKRLTEFYQTSI